MTKEALKNEREESEYLTPRRGQEIVFLLTENAQETKSL